MLAWILILQIVQFIYLVGIHWNICDVMKRQQHLIEYARNLACFCQELYKNTVNKSDLKGTTKND